MAHIENMLVPTPVYVPTILPITFLRIVQSILTANLIYCQLVKLLLECSYIDTSIAINITYILALKRKSIPSQNGGNN